MADYLRFVCEPMWNLIDSGKCYYSVDPNNLTPSEVFDRHLNLATIGFLKRGMDGLTRAPFLHITNAKELWDTLLIAKSGTRSLQMTRYETAKHALQNLHMKKYETSNNSICVSKFYPLMSNHSLVRSLWMDIKSPTV